MNQTVLALLLRLAEAHIMTCRATVWPVQDRRSVRPTDDRRRADRFRLSARAAHNVGPSGQARRVRTDGRRPVSGVVLFSDAR
jgi:hypothetical protein